ncbi:hypothetical protein K445DRAFT_255785 [Daldinia sp. EC12]|nr:hypothetical protein K445DRAFT_255785 [Daldinia sp. EC12]
MQGSKGWVRLFQIITLSLYFSSRPVLPSLLRVFRASSPMVWGRVSRLDRMDSRGIMSRRIISFSRLGMRFAEEPNVLSLFLSFFGTCPLS